MRLRIFADVRFQQFSRVTHRGQQQYTWHNFQGSQRRIHRAHLRNSNRTCHTPPHPVNFPSSLFPLLLRLHQGICLNTPARTNAASTNASNTAHASIEKPRCFTGPATACPGSFIAVSPFTFAPKNHNPLQAKLANFSSAHLSPLHSLWPFSAIPDLFPRPTPQLIVPLRVRPAESKAPAIALRFPARQCRSSEPAALPEWLAKPPRKASPATTPSPLAGPQLRPNAFPPCKSQSSPPQLPPPSLASYQFHHSQTPCTQLAKQ